MTNNNEYKEIDCGIINCSQIHCFPPTCEHYQGIKVLKTKLENIRKEYKESEQKLHRLAEIEHDIKCTNYITALESINKEMYEALETIKQLIDKLELYNELNIELIYDRLESILEKYKPEE